MKRMNVCCAITLTCLLFSGCATVKVYSDESLKTETGLRFYTLKPYLLVEYMANKDNTVKASVIYLPDLSSPQYVRIKPGVGSSELKMTFTNSALESYGVAADSKLPESMAAFADILSKSAYAAQALGVTPPLNPPGDEEFVPALATVLRLFEIVSTPSGTVLKEVEL